MRKADHRGRQRLRARRRLRDGAGLRHPPGLRRGRCFGQPEINLGIMPGWGGTQRLARTTSLGFAKELILTGRNVDGRRGARARAGAGRATARGAAAEGAGDGRRRSRRRARSPSPTPRTPPTARCTATSAPNLVHEADLFSILFSTEDAKEGLAPSPRSARPASAVPNGGGRGRSAPLRGSPRPGPASRPPRSRSTRPSRPGREPAPGSSEPGRCARWRP